MAAHDLALVPPLREQPIRAAEVVGARPTSAQGRDAVFGQFGRYGGDTGGIFKAELKQVFTSDDGRVIGLHHNSGERNGKRLDTDCCIVFEVANGRMMSGREHFFSSTTGTSSGPSPDGPIEDLWMSETPAHAGRHRNAPPGGARVPRPGRSAELVAATALAVNEDASKAREPASSSQRTHA